MSVPRKVAVRNKQQLDVMRFELGSRDKESYALTRSITMLLSDQQVTSTTPSYNWLLVGVTTPKNLFVLKM